MKKILTLAFVTLLLMQAAAQSNSMVILKNGSEIRGRVLKNDETGVQIRTRDGSLWNFTPDEVVSVKDYSPTVSSTGFYNRTSVGVMGGDMVSPSLYVVNGYSFNQHWEAGFGMGLESFYWNTYIPLFLEGRYSFFNGPTKPFVALNAGYEMPVRNMEFNKGGFTGGVQLGITHYFSNHVGIVTSAGYRFALLKEESMWWDDFETIRQINRYEIRLGFVFR